MRWALLQHAHGTSVYGRTHIKYTKEPIFHMLNFLAIFTIVVQNGQFKKVWIEINDIIFHQVAARLFWFFNNFFGYTLIGVHATKGKVTNLIQFSEDTVFVLSKRWLHNGQKVKPKSESGCCLYIWCINSNCASLFLSIKFCC